MPRGDAEPRSPITVATVGAWIIYAFLVVPTLIVIPMSFGEGCEHTFPPRVWGLSLYRQMLDPAKGWLDAGWNSLQIAGIAAALAVTLGVPAAYALGRRAGFGFLRFFVISPIFIPAVVLALGLYLFFIRLGISGTKLGLVAAHTMVITPFVILTVGAALKRLDRNIEVAASVLGAGTLRIFFEVALPALGAAILSAAFFAFLLSFDEVVLAWFIGKGAEPTLPVKMYSSIQWEVSPVIAAVSTVLVIITSLGCLIAALLQATPAERT